LLLLLFPVFGPLPFLKKLVFRVGKKAVAIAYSLAKFGFSVGFVGFANVYAIRAGLFIFLSNIVF